MTDACTTLVHRALLADHGDHPTEMTRSALLAAAAVEGDRAREFAAAGQPEAVRRALHATEALAMAAGAAELTALYAEVAKTFAESGDDLTAEEFLRHSIALEDVPLGSTRAHLAALLHRTGRTREAEPLYREAIERLTPDPSVAAVHDGLATLLWQMGRATEAIEHAERALTLHRGRHRAEQELDLAHMLEGAGRTGEAIARYESLLEVGSSTAAKLGLARVLARSGRIDDAMALLDGEPSVREETVELLEDAGRYEAAEALTRDPLARGRLLRRTGRLSDAEAAFRTAPKTPESRLGLAAVLVDLGRLTEAIHEAHEAIAHGRTPLEELHDLAVVFGESGRPDEAAALMQRALRESLERRGAGHPHTGAMMAHLATLRSASGSPEAADSLSEHALHLAIAIHGADHPVTASRRARRARVLYQLRRLDEAESLLAETCQRTRRLGTSHPSHGRACSDLGRLLAAVDERLDEAEHTSVQAIQILAATYGHEHPAVSADYFALAGLRVRRGRLAEAHVALDRALAIEHLVLERSVLHDSLAQRRRRLDRAEAFVAAAITLHLRFRPDAVSSARLAMRTILRREGRDVEFGHDTLRAARSDVEAAATLLAVRDARSRLDQLDSVPPDDPANLDHWRSERRSARAGLTEREAMLWPHLPALQRAPITLSAVAEALGPRRALLELVSYTPWSVDGNDATERVAAYLLVVGSVDEAGPITISGRDLGSRNGLLATIETLRTTLRERRAAEEAAIAVFRTLFEPMAPLLRTIEELVVAGDVEVGLTPLDFVLATGGIGSMSRRSATATEPSAGQVKACSIASMPPIECPMRCALSRS